VYYCYLIGFSFNREVRKVKKKKKNKRTKKKKRTRRNPILTIFLLVGAGCRDYRIYYLSARKS